jgi:hypothetical protein
MHVTLWFLGAAVAVSACAQEADERIGSFADELIIIEDPPRIGSSSLDFPNWISGTSGDTLELFIHPASGGQDFLYFTASAAGPFGDGRPNFQVDATEINALDAYVSYDLWCNHGAFWRRFASRADVLMHDTSISGDGAALAVNEDVVCPAGAEFFASVSWNLEHNKCTAGEPRDRSFDACVRAVCQGDSFCCDIQWDGVCVDEAKQWCHMTCPS